MILAWSSESPDEAIMARKLLISLVGSLSMLNWKFHAAINIRTGCGNCLFFMYDEVSTCQAISYLVTNGILRFEIHLLHYLCT